ncbi:MAG: hypothetical protein GY862_18130, partial [Gammaproteobacteria bacterium]|nr:hypothetical protein [Gammaproteobacteria bacterium]
MKIFDRFRKEANNPMQEIAMPETLEDATRMLAEVGSMEFKLGKMESELAQAVAAL